jgi:transposase
VTRLQAPFYLEMTKEFLAKCLAEGLSLEQIGHRAGKHPSTVSYHLKKHGLVANGRRKHSPNGKVDPDQLRGLLEGGVTLRAAAEELGVSYSTIRHWVTRLGLSTGRMNRLRESALAMDLGLTEVDMKCGRHGVVRFTRRHDGNFRCSKCRSEDVSERRRRVKRRLVVRAGGRCQLCGYDRCLGALEHHHVDSDSKKFSISRNGVTRSFEEVAAEADKCVLLCANCHAEVGAGVIELPASLRLPGTVDDLGAPPG